MSGMIKDYTPPDETTDKAGCSVTLPGKASFVPPRNYQAGMTGMAALLALHTGHEGGETETEWRW